eukprot:PhF_6_TR10077/c0_g1_i1/m.15650
MSDYNLDFSCASDCKGSTKGTDKELLCKMCNVVDTAEVHFNVKKANIAYQVNEMFLALVVLKATYTARVSGYVSVDLVMTANMSVQSQWKREYLSNEIATPFGFTISVAFD